MPSALSSRNLYFWGPRGFQGSPPAPSPCGHHRGEDRSLCCLSAGRHPRAGLRLGLGPPTLPAWCLAQPWVGDTPQGTALSSTTGRPGWAAQGGSSRRAPQSPRRRGEQLEGCREGPRRLAVSPPHPLPSQRPLPAGLPHWTGPASPSTPLHYPLPAPLLPAPLRPSPPLPRARLSSSPLPLSPFPILSSPLLCNPLFFSESFSLASFLSSSWVKNNPLSGKQQLLLSRPPPPLGSP